MKSMILIVCTALATIATGASAAEPAGTSGREKAVMLYFAKSFGSTQRQNRMPFTYGLKLQQSSPFDSRQPIDMVDLRYTMNGRSSLVLAGTLSFDSTGESSQESSDASSSAASTEHKGITITLVTLGLIGLACAAEWGICESDDSSTETATPGTPTGPG